MENLNKIKFSRNRVTGIVQIYSYKDEIDNIYYAECPALDIISYGDTEEEANRMLEEAIKINLDYMYKKHTLESELIRLGWKKNSLNKNKFENSMPDRVPSYLAQKQPTITSQKINA